MATQTIRRIGQTIAEHPKKSAAAITAVLYAIYNIALAFGVPIPPAVVATIPTVAELIGDFIDENEPSPLPAPQPGDLLNGGKENDSPEPDDALIPDPSPTSEKNAGSEGGNA